MQLRTFDHILFTNNVYIWFWIFSLCDWLCSSEYFLRFDIKKWNADAVHCTVMFSFYKKKYWRISSTEKRVCPKTWCGGSMDPTAFSGKTEPSLPVTVCLRWLGWLGLNMRSKIDRCYQGKPIRGRVGKVLQRKAAWHVITGLDIVGWCMVDSFGMEQCTLLWLAVDRWWKFKREPFTNRSKFEHILFNECSLFSCRVSPS